jgi:hypothetical protein
VAGGLNEPYGMVIDATNVYFAEQPTSDVKQVAKGGGTVTAFASVPTNSYPWGLAILGNHLFVEENGTISTVELTVPGGTGPTTILAAGNPFAVYAAGSYVFWTNSTVSTSAIYRGAVGSANSGAVYWSLGSVSPGAIFADTTNVYWTDSNNNVSKCPANICTSSTTLAPSQPGVYAYGGLAVDSSQMVYWAGYQNSTGAFVRRCPAAGCSAPFEVSSYSSISMNYQLGGIAVDATYVYWSVWDNGTVYIFKSAK